MHVLDRSLPGYMTDAHSTADGRRQAMWAGNSVDWLLRGDPTLFFEVRAALGQLLCEGR
jgi:hypothetical protein